MIKTPQEIAKDLYLDSATFENNFKPLSDQKISDQLKALGHDYSKSAVFKWRNKEEWKKALDHNIKLALSQDEDVKGALSNAPDDSSVKQAVVDIDRNRNLMSLGYKVLEAKAVIILKDYQASKKISDADAKLMVQVMQVTGNREDRMLDRSVMRDALGAKDAMKSIEDVLAKQGIEFDGDVDVDAIETGIVDIEIEGDEVE